MWPTSSSVSHSFALMYVHEHTHTHTRHTRLLLFEGQVTVYGLSEQILSEDQQAELTPSSQSAEVFDLFTLLSSLLKPA